MIDRPTTRRTRRLATLLIVGSLVLPACSSGDATAPNDPTPTNSTPTDSTPGTESDLPTPTTVRLLTHDSFNVSEDLLDQFTAHTSITVEILRGGDAGTMVNQAILTAGNPQADVLYGIDNTLLSRAFDADLFVGGALDVTVPLEPGLAVDDNDQVVPIDRGDVCLNYDKAAFAQAGAAVPETLEDLIKPEYAGMLAVENPATSSPGLAFLLGTISALGDGWTDYWSALAANDISISSGWEQAYYSEFSGSGGSEGSRPLVVSYASSPAAEVIFAETPLDEAPTGVIPGTCVRQVEYAGILSGSQNQEAAATLIDWMLSVEFQADVAMSMFVFPARSDVALPPEFVKHTVLPDNPIELDAAEVAANRDDWIDEWTRIVLG